MTKAERVAKVVEATTWAYSRALYTDGGWAGVARKLIDAGFTDEQAEAVLRSKHMRWAGEQAKRNRYVTTADFMRYVAKNYGGLNMPKFAAIEKPFPLSQRSEIAEMIICAGDADVAALIELALEIRDGGTDATPRSAMQKREALRLQAAEILTQLERRSRG